MRASVLCIAGLLSAASALTITSPTDGQTLDLLQPITFSWTSTSSDPDTFDIVLDNSGNGGLVDNVKVATGVSTSSGNYILPAGISYSYGDGFVLRAETTSGDILAASPPFTLGTGSATTVDGQISYVSTITYTGTVSEGPATATVTGADGNMPTGSGSGQATLGGVSETTGNTASATGSSSFMTSTVSRSGSTTGTSSASSASASSSQNAQPKLGSNSQIAFTAAGVIAGLAALLA